MVSEGLRAANPTDRVLIAEARDGERHVGNRVTNRCGQEVLTAFVDIIQQGSSHNSCTEISFAEKRLIITVFHKNHMCSFRAPSVTGAAFRPCVSFLQVSPLCAMELLCWGVFRALPDGQLHPRSPHSKRPEAPLTQPDNQKSPDLATLMLEGIPSPLVENPYKQLCAC